MRTLLSLLLTFACIETAIPQLVVTYESSNVPLAIPDGPGRSVESLLTINDYYPITDVNVVLTITHTFVFDLAIYVEAPDEDVVRIYFHCSTSGENLTDTHFDDEASMAICDGGPPYTGTYRPNHPLTAFDGRRNNGTWILRVADDAAFDVGTLDSWRLEMTVDTTVNANVPPNAALFTLAQNYPNPFNATTVLPLALAHPSLVKFTIYSIDGRTMHQSLQNLTAGQHDLRIDGTNWSSGSYLADVIAGTQRQTVRMMLLK